MKKKLLSIAIAIAMFPGFVNGLYYLKKDLTFLYCAVSKSCNNK